MIPLPRLQAFRADRRNPSGHPFSGSVNVDALSCGRRWFSMSYLSRSKVSAPTGNTLQDAVEFVSAANPGCSAWPPRVVAAVPIRGIIDGDLVHFPSSWHDRIRARPGRIVPGVVSVPPGMVELDDTGIDIGGVPPLTDRCCRR